MPQEQPTFTSTPLENPPPKKIRRRRAPSAAKKRTTKKEKFIDSQLAEIYTDGNGRMPDMRQIRIKRHHPFVKFFFFLVIVGALLAGAAWAGLLVLPEKNFAEEKVALSVTGPSATDIGATTTYKIYYQNGQAKILKNAVVSLNFPHGFIYLASDPAADNPGHTEWKLGDLAPDASGAINITGLMYGQPKEEQSWRVFLTYRPENMNSDLQKIAVTNVVTNDSPVLLEISGPAKSVVGNNAEFTLKATAAAGWPSEKLVLKPILPHSFYLLSATPALGSNQTWEIKAAPSTSSTLIFKLDGKFVSSSEQYANLKANLSLLAKTSGQFFSLTDTGAATQLENNDINLNLAINGSSSDFNTHPGEILNTSLFLKNMTKIEMKNVSITLDLDAPSLKNQSLLDWSQLVDEKNGTTKGSQLGPDVRRGEIVWNKTQITELTKIKAGDSVTIDIRLPIKSADSFNLSDLKGFTINANPQLTYTDAGGKSQTVSGNPIAITINSDLKLEVRDTASTNGASEEHKIIWMLSNNFHPLKNLILSADVYGNAAFSQAPSSTPAGLFGFDNSTKKLTWTIDEMPLSVDVLALPFSITLSDKNPSQKVLVSKIHVQATDAVTGQNLDFMADEVGINQ